MSGRPVLTARWCDLALLTWEVDPGLLRAPVPPGTELDRFEGRALVTLVGFRFLDTRVLGFSIPFHRDFPEVNLRFYVRRAAPEGWRRGVVFLRELVPRRAVAWVARAWYGEPYLALRMRHRVALGAAPEGAPGAVEYQWRRRGRWQGLRVTTAGRPALPAPGSEAEFVTGHYWGYTALRDGGAREYRVAHPRWPVWAAAEASVDRDAAEPLGPSLVEALRAPPSSALVAVGSPVAVHAARRLPAP